jgi:hypothetical protein
MVEFDFGRSILRQSSLGLTLASWRVQCLDN